ncbi:hypothetical protein BD410DRAFT_810073 [Rickenella mellea]|uniref:Uncharacterized protein n=1 Tax=Rickenella mellea TaxID=50990 RepID=A0A4Y7PG37_9AGAM|nr:hypothetical protein BD410DRAFT_810073 [Rickenella mellea]
MSNRGANAPVCRGVEVAEVVVALGLHTSRMGAFVRLCVYMEVVTAAPLRTSNTIACVPIHGGGGGSDRESPHTLNRGGSAAVCLSRSNGNVARTCADAGVSAGTGGVGIGSAHAISTSPRIIALSLAIAVLPLGCCAGASACVALTLQVAACALLGAVEEAIVVAKVEVEVEVEVEVMRP